MKEIVSTEGWKEAAEQEYERLKVDNKADFDAMTRQGIQFGPLDGISMRLEGVIDGLFPPGSDERLALDLAFEQRVAQYIAEAKAQVNRAVLLSPDMTMINDPGVPGKNGLHSV